MGNSNNIGIVNLDVEEALMFKRAVIYLIGKSNMNVAWQDIEDTQCTPILDRNLPYSCAKVVLVFGGVQPGSATP